MNVNGGVCEFCKMETYTRKHHLTPRSKGGKATANTCPTCEGWIHGRWSHNELRDVYNSVESILANEEFAAFLKWRLKQSPTALFKSSPSKSRHRTKYS